MDKSFFGYKREEADSKINVLQKKIEDNESTISMLQEKCVNYEKVIAEKNSETIDLTTQLNNYIMQYNQAADKVRQYEEELYDIEQVYKHAFTSASDIINTSQKEAPNMSNDLLVNAERTNEQAIKALVNIQKIVIDFEIIFSSIIEKAQRLQEEVNMLMGEAKKIPESFNHVSQIREQFSENNDKQIADFIERTNKIAEQKGVVESVRTGNSFYLQSKPDYAEMLTNMFISESGNKRESESLNIKLDKDDYTNVIQDNTTQEKHEEESTKSYNNEKFSFEAENNLDDIESNINIKKKKAEKVRDLLSKYSHIS